MLASISCAISIEVSNYTNTGYRTWFLTLSTGNIGNAKTLNANKKHDLLSETNMTNYQYVIALMVFLIAYAIFEVPSNYMLKKFSPSRWIAFLMFSWATITMGLGGVHNFATVTVLRFLLGVFEAGLFPGLVCRTNSALNSLHVLIFFLGILFNVLVPHRRAQYPCSTHPCFRNFGWCIRWSNRLWSWSHGPGRWTRSFPLALHP